MANKVPTSVANPKRSDKIPTWIEFHRCLSGNMDKRIFDMKKQSGFTLIELMIVVAIVAILAAIALPAYQTYTKKAKFSEVISATGAFKTAVEVCYQTTGAMTTCAANGSGGIPSAAGASGYVTSVEVDNSVGDVAITAIGDTTVFGSDSTYIMSGSASGGQILWTQPASGSTCTSAGIC